jgi:UDP:flavonoid glycosyltransferase YjiC (YdhE family)
VRVLFTTHPAYGHLHPLVPLARALAASGHDVRIAASPAFAAELAATGLTPVPAGLDWLAADAEDAFPEGRGRGKRFMLEEIFCWGAARPLAVDLLDLAQEWRPEVVVREIWEFGGAVVAARLGVPCVVHGIGPWLNAEEVAGVGHERLLQLGAEHGLDDELAWLAGDLYVDPCPPSLQIETATPPPPNVQLVRPIPFDTTRDGAGAGFPDGIGPAIHVTLGTIMHRRRGVLEAVMEELATFPARIVVTTGPGREPLGALPANVRVAEYVPLTALLPECDLVVCHAGWGTLIASLAHGVPLVCLPLGADGFTNAERCTTVGVGAVADGTPGSVRRAVADVLRDDAYHLLAAAAQAEIEAMPGLDEAVARVEALV